MGTLKEDAEMLAQTIVMFRTSVSDKVGPEDSQEFLQLVSKLDSVAKRLIYQIEYANADYWKRKTKEAEARLREVAYFVAEKLGEDS